MRDLRPTNKHDRRYLAAIEGLGELALEEINVGFDAISWPHFNGEEVVATPLGFLVSIILCEEGIGGLCEVVERSGWLGLKPP